MVFTVVDHQSCCFLSVSTAEDPGFGRMEGKASLDSMILHTLFCTHQKAVATFGVHTVRDRDVVSISGVSQLMLLTEVTQSLIQVHAARLLSAGDVGAPCGK